MFTKNFQQSKNNNINLITISNQFIESHPDIICISTSDGRIAYGNTAFNKFYGYNHEDLKELDWYDLIIPEDHEKLEQHQANRKKSSTFINLRSMNSDGKICLIQWVDNCLKSEIDRLDQTISIGREITNLQENNHEITKCLQFERLITSLMAGFINLPPEEIDTPINQVLSKVGLFTEVDRSYLFLLSSDMTSTNTHEWCRKGVISQKHNLQNIPATKLPWLLEKLQNFEIINITDVSKLPASGILEQEVFQAQDIKSILIVSVVSHSKMLGFVGFDAVNQKKFWSDEDIKIIKFLGKIIGNAIDQQRTQNNLKLHKSFLEKLNQLTIDSLNAKNVHEMLDIVAGQISSLINADNCSINLWDQKSKQVYCSAYHGKNAEFYKNFEIKKDEVCMTSSVLEAGRPIIVDDVKTSPYVNQRIASKFSTQSLLGVPMIVNGKKLGSVLFGFETPHHFLGDEIAISVQATSQIGQALLKINLIEQTQRSAEEAETLLRAGKIVSSTLDPEVSIKRILDQLVMAVPYGRASIQILEDDILLIKAARGWPEDESPMGAEIPIPGNNANTIVIQTKQPHVVNKINDNTEIFTGDSSSQYASWLGVPLVVREKIIGMLTLEHQELHFYDDERRINLAAAFADLVAISLENARLYAEQTQRVRELDALRATTADITKELSFEILLGAILERAISLLNATGGELGLVDETGNGINILLSHNMGVNKEGTKIKQGEGLMGYVLLTRKIEMVEDYTTWDNRLEIYNDTTIHAAMAAPLMIGSRILGVISIMNSDRRKRFNDSEKSLLNLFAQQAAIAVHNAQLFKELEQEARMDLLTNTYNRRGLFELGNRELDRAERYQRPISVIMLDIDHFKKVNDIYGHTTGDRILKFLAERIQENLRKIDILARYGGEEFVILLIETNQESALLVAERLRKAVEQQPYKSDNLKIPITVSIGLTTSESGKISLEVLIQQADDAMYQSKNAGRNQVTVYQ